MSTIKLVYCDNGFCNNKLAVIDDIPVEERTFLHLCPKCKEERAHATTKLRDLFPEFAHNFTTED